MMVRQVTFLALLLLIVPFTMAASRVPSKRPNILFILLDNVGKDWIRCYGSQENQTPNIDRLCYTGIKFRNYPKARERRH